MSPSSSSPQGDLILVGSGGFGRETAQAVLDLNADGARWRLLGYLDDDPARHGTVVDGLPVLGGRDQLADLPGVSVVVCTGRPGNYISRMRIVAELDLPADRYATIIHPSVSVSASSDIGPGSVLLAQAALTASVRIGAHVAVMPHVTLTHDCVISAYATIASRVAVGGGARIDQAAYLGAGSVIGEGRHIGEYSLVGMGAVVTRDVPAREVWVGVPARYLRAAALPPVPAGQGHP
jgi:sugar O-acyltransferase (sialic acid O-acetyltransferase NeuD family)